MDKTINQVYKERALVVSCMATLADSIGITVRKTQSTADDWAILYIELPAGQVSWHFSKEDEYLIKAFITDNDYKWDGNYNGRDDKIMTNPYGYRK